MAISGQGVLELQKPDLALVDSIDMKPGSFGRSAANEFVVTHCNMLLTSWCSTMRAALEHKRDILTEVRRLRAQCWLVEAAVTQ